MIPFGDDWSTTPQTMKSPSSNDEHANRSADQTRLEQIVSYLDGELPPVENDLIERQLVEDDAFRAELQSLDRAWSALDALPANKVDDRFSKTTLELVVDVAKQELAEKTLALPVQRRKHWLANLVLALTTGVLALLAVSVARENPNGRLLADLPAIQYIGIYTQFQDVSYLSALHEALGDPPWTNNFSEEELAALTEEFDTIDNPEARQQWIRDLDPEGQATLRGHFNQFETISEKEQQRLHNLHAVLAASPDRAELVPTMLAYEQWLLGLTASLQFELREMAPEARVRRVVAMIDREAPPDSIKLSTKELQALRKQMQEIREEVLSSLQPEQRQRLESAGPNSGRGGRFARNVPRFVEKFRAAVESSLEEENRAKFAALSPPQQREQAFRWIQELRGSGDRRRFPRDRFSEMVTQEELEQFFVEELNAGEKERLLALPRDQFEQRLRRLYLQGEGPEGEDFSREGPPRPFGDPRNGPRGRGRGFGPPRERRDDMPPPRGDEFGGPRGGFDPGPPPFEDPPPR